jgi:alkylated DNA nucleotide flippase Atl1
MASSRAQEVAELLWELKRADKLGTYTAIAQRAGFSVGPNDRTIKSTLKLVRRDWPHLQWWRAIPDDLTVNPKGEQIVRLKEMGIEVSTKEKEGRVKVKLDDDQLMVWPEEEAAAEAKD